VWDGQDRLIGQFSRALAVAAGASYSQVRTVGLPQVPAGNYYLILRADGSNRLYESNEANNDRAVAITLTTPDLTPTGLTAPGSAVAGHQIPVWWTVENQGTGEARPSWYDYLYLSTDNVWDGQDRLIGQFSRGLAVVAGASYSQVRTVGLPQVPAGNYYLILRADGSNRLYESNEANNDRAVAITLTTPDLTPTALTAPGSAVAGQQIPVWWTVENQGTGEARPSWYDYLYLSTDNVWDGQDRLIGQFSRALAVAAGASYSQVRTVGLPQVPAGNYYLILRADGNSNLYESDETNNDRTVAITLSTPDLTPTALTAPASAVAGQQIPVWWTVENQGTGEARPSWYDYLYLSTDNVWDGQDRLIGQFSRALAVAAGASYSQVRTVGLPQVPAGNYYLILRADGSNRLYESNEANNDRAVAIILTTPDLTPTALAGPASAVAGQQIPVSWTVGNQGTGEARPSWYDYIYLSTDNVWDGQDRLIGQLSRGLGVAAGASYSQAQTVGLPQVPAGGYYLILRVDANGNLYESDETNNERTVAITLTTPDLTPTALAGPASAVSGQQIPVWWTVENQGTGEARPSWYDYIYLSTDSVWDGQDTRIGYFSRGLGVAAGASYSQAQTVGLPQVPAGNYYLVLRADPNNNLYESDETNNERTVAITLTTPDLTPTALTGPGSAVAGQQIPVSWTVENQGTGEAWPSWYDYIYLSTDSVWDGQDTRIGYFSRGLGVAAGASYSQIRTVGLPQVPAGDYYLILRADANGNLYESDETNNERVVVIALTTPDLTPTALTGPASAFTSQQIEVTWAVENRGSGEARSSWYDYLYLSTDNVWDGQDRLIGQFSRGLGVAAGATYGQAQTVGVPQVPAGDYYLILRADGRGDLYESDEANNDRAVPISLTTPDLTPADVMATPGNAQVTISWTAVTGATSYNIYYATVPGVTKLTGIKIADVTSPYTHTGLTNGTTYYYVVIAVNTGVESAESGQVSAMPIIGGGTSIDLTPTALTAPASAATQQQIEIGWTVQNQGTSDARPSWYDRLYLSTNNVWDTSDVELTYVYRSIVLLAGDSYFVARTVRIPSVPADSYYLLVRTDHNGYISESNEANNGQAVAITVTTPDLIPTALTAPASVVAEQQIEVSWTVENQGTGEVRPSWSDHLYFSTNDVWDDQDTRLGSFQWNHAVAAGASYSQVQTVRLPEVPAGSYYLILRTDHYDYLYEANEANNELAVAVDLTTPDLTPTALTVPASAVAEQQIEVSWTVQNQGTGEARPSWSDHLYFSSNDVWDDQDTRLGYFQWNHTLAAGASYTQTQTVRLPEVPAGTCYLILRTDHYDYLYESNEANNDRAVAIILTTPDLTPTGLTAPASAVAEQQIEVSWTVENQGTGAAQPYWYDRLYFSTNEVWDDQDTQLGSFQWNHTLAAGASYTQTQIARLPQVPAGTYYLILRADGSNRLYESNEANNDSAVTIILTTPDLTPTPLTAPASGVAEQQIEVSWTVENQGTGEAQPYWYDRLYFSTNDLWDDQDTQLGSFRWNHTVAAGASYTQTQTVRLPEVPAGTYYLILRADSDNRLYESNEANNERAVAITVTTPDLTPTVLTAPASGVAEQQIEVSWTVENQGTGEARPYWHDRLYFSTNDVWDDQDTQLGYFQWNHTLAAGASYTETQTVRLPEVPAGSYYLILRTDHYDYLYEANEANNDRAVAITPTTPDLTPTVLTAPASGVAEQQIEVSWTVENQGTGEARPYWHDRLYFSTNDVWDDQDTQLGYFQWNHTLAAGASYTETQTVRLPEVPAGSYYLILRTDHYDYLYEANEANNDRAVAITVTTPDLTPTVLTAPASAVAGQQIEVSWTVENPEAGEAQPYWYDRLYFSADDVWDDQDTQLGSFRWNHTLAAGASYTQTQIARLPQVPAGSYYLILWTDSDNRLYESNEANNGQAVAIALTTPDLTPTALTAPASAVAEKQIELSWTVENQGTGEAQPYWYDRLYFSADDVWDDQDTQLGSFQWNHAVAAGASYSQVQTVRLPEVPAGSYYLILRTDHYDYLYEANEANNETQQSIEIRIADAVTTPWRTLDSGEDGAPSLGSLDFSPDGVRLVAAGGNRAFTWDVPTGDLRGRFTAHTAQIDTVDFSPVGDQVLSGARDGTSRIWDASSRQQIRSFPAATNQPNPAVYSADGAWIFAGSGLGLPRLWDAVTGEELQTFSGHTGAVNAVALSPDGSKALTGSSDKTAILWSTETGTRLFTLSRHTSIINAVAFSPDGTQALTASNDGTISLWDVASGAQTGVFIQGSPVVWAVFSPDGRYIVSCDSRWPGTTYLWQVSSGALVRTFSETDGDPTRMNGVAISPDGTLIATSHSDGQVRLWQSGLEAIPLHPITPLAVGSELTVTLRSHGLYYFEIDAESGRNLLITLGPGTSQAGLQAQEKGSAASSDAKFANLAGKAAATSLSNSSVDPTAVRVVARRGSLPSAYEYDYFAQAPVSNLHAEIPIAPTSAAKYYVLVFSPYLAQGSINASIRADYVGFHISSLWPDSGGNAGNVTAHIRGTGLTADTMARLVAPGGALITGATPLLINPVEMFVTFDVRGAATGFYDVQIEKPGYASIALEDAFEITGGIGSRLEARLEAPTAVRPQRYSTLWLEYANVGDADMGALLFIVSSVPTVPMTLRKDAPYETEPVQILGVNFDGPAGVLPPGARYRIPIYFQAATDTAEVTFNLEMMIADATLIDWNAVEAEVRPPTADPEVWDMIWAELTSQIGEGWGDYISTLRADAALLPEQLGHPFVVRDVLQIAIHRAEEQVSRTIAGTVIDDTLGLPARGDRIYLASQDGVMQGFGWILNDGTFAVTGAELGTYTILFENYVGADGPAQVVVPDEGVEDLNIRVLRGGFVSGMVRAASTEQPLSGASVVARDQEGNAYTGMSTGDGSYSIGPLPPGTYDIVISSETHAPTRIEKVQVGTGEEVTAPSVDLTTGALVFGTVSLAAGGPDADSYVVEFSSPDGTAKSREFPIDAGFTIGGLAAGSYRARILAPGYAAETVEPIELAAGEAFSLPALTLQPGGALEGTIMSLGSGVGIANASIVLSQGEDVAATSASTSDGTYYIDNLVPGAYMVLVTAEGFWSSSQTVDVPAGEATSWSVELHPAGSILGTVTSADTGSGLVGITVQAASEDGALHSSGTDAVGHYELADLPPGTYTVGLGDMGFAHLVQTPVVLDESTPAPTIDFALEVVGFVSGTIYDSDGNTPIEGALVALGQDGKVIALAQSAADGSYGFAVLKEDTYAVDAFTQINAFPAQTDIVVNSGAQLSGIDLVAGDLYVGGSVVDGASGQPVAGSFVSVVASSQGTLLRQAGQAPVEADGSFLVSGLATGAFKVIAQAPGYAAQTVDVTLSEGGTTPSITFELTPGATISGTVLEDVTGNPIAGATVIVTKASADNETALTHTDDSGLYQIEGLGPGIYNITVLDNVHQVSVAVIDVPAGDTVVRDFSLLASSTQVTGRVLDNVGLPVGNAEVIAVDAGGHLFGEALTGPDGSFTINGLPPGTYSVVAEVLHHAAPEAVPIVVEAGSTLTGVELAVARAAIAVGEAPSSTRTGNAPFASGSFSHVASHILPASTQWAGLSSAAGESGTVGIGSFLDDWLFGRTEPACPECQGEWDAMIAAQQRWLRASSKFHEASNRYWGKALWMIGKVEIAIVANAAVAGLAKAVGALAARFGLPILHQIVAEIAAAGVGNILKGAILDVKIGQPGKVQGALENARSEVIKGATKLAGYDIANDLGGRGLASALWVKAVVDKVGKLLNVLSVLSDAITLGILRDWDQLIRLANEFNVAEDELEYAQKAHNAARRAYKQCEKECKRKKQDPKPPEPPSEFIDTTSTDVVRPIDPNDKLGPEGVGLARTVSADDELAYVIRFENMTTATAPVQELVVIDYLDPNLNWTTFQFSDIAYGDRLIPVPGGVIEFSTRDFPTPPTITGTVSGTMAIDITACVNPQTGRVEWRLRAIDTVTGLPPEDPFAGFLPPEDSTGRGQGHVSFSIMPKAYVAMGTRITNTASIIFDTNDPIETDPAAWNTIGELSQLQFGAVMYAVDENGGSATISVVRTGGSSGAVTVNYAPAIALPPPARITPPLRGPSPLPMGTRLRRPSPSPSWMMPW